MKVKINDTWDLGQGYSLRLMEQEEFDILCRPHHAQVFLSNKPVLKRDKVLTAEEKERTKQLAECLKGIVRLNFGVFFEGNFVGWHFGMQRTNEIYYMTNSALLEAHRGKGVYKAMLKKIVEVLEDFGFQSITSRHIATNNSVIVPKLKANFVITGMEVSEVFGVLVNLTYHVKKIRRDILEFRCGDVFANEEIESALK